MRFEQRFWDVACEAGSGFFRAMEAQAKKIEASFSKIWSIL